MKGGELVRITPEPGLVLCDFTKTVELLEKLSKDLFAIDVSASLAGLSVRGEAVMRRITDLDLDALPAAGAVSHVQAIVTRDGDSFALWFAQEYSDYLAEVVIDAYGGLHRMKDIFRVRRMWRPRAELKDRYDVVIIGGGSHGLATAYYLAKNHGITDVAILEKNYIGSGAAGRNTTIVRANYRTPEGAEFYKASVKLYEGLGADLDFNLLFSQQGHLTLAHSDRGDHHRERAGRGEQAPRDRQPRHLPGRDPRSSARRWTSPRTSPGRCRRRSTTRRAGSSATTPSSGASRAAPTAAASRSTRTPR